MDLIEKYDYFLFDCDGVLWNGKLEIENAFIALRLILSHKNKKVFFITNNSTRERKTVQQDKCEYFKFDLPIECIYTSGYVASQYLKTQVLKNSEDSVYVIGEQGLKNELMNHGIKVINSQNQAQDEVSMSDHEIGTSQMDSSVKVVIVGADTGFSYRKLCTASLYFDLNDSQFIATNRDRVFKTNQENRFMPGGGSIVRSIEVSSGRTPLTIGKPNTLSFDLLRKEHNLQDEQLSKFLMVGDSLLTDIKFGNNCGIDTLLVLSGCTNSNKARQLKLGNINEGEGNPTFISPYFTYSLKHKF